MNADEPTPAPPAPPRARTVARWVLGYVLPHWRTFVMALALMGVYAGANTVRLGMLALLFDGVIAPGDPTEPTGNVMRVYQEWVVPHLGPEYAFDPQVAGTFDLEWIEVVDGERVADAKGFVIRRGMIGAAAGKASHLASLRLEREPFTELSLKLADGVVDPGADWKGKRFGPLVARIVTGGQAEDRLFPILIAFAILGTVLALIIATSNFGREYLANSIVVHVIADMRADLFRHLSLLSLPYFHRRRSGELISRVTNDVGSLQMALRYVFGEVLQHPLTIVSSLVMAFVASPALTFISLPFLPLMFIPMLRSGRKVKKHGRGTLARLGEVTEVMSQLLSGIRVVKAFNMEAAQEAEFRQKTAGFIRANLRMLRAKVMARSVLEGIYNLLAAVLLAFGGWLLVNRFFQLNLGDFAVFLSAVAMMYQPLKALTKAYNTMAESLAGGERVLEVLQEKPTVPDRPGAPRFPRLAERIEFRGVSYRYDPDQPWVLQDVSFTAEKGSTVALVGPSGAGKSTLLDLLARFYDPVRGAILIDGMDLRDGTHASLLAQTAIVGQDAFLFHTSIYENILNGRPEASREEVETAARAAAIHDEILQFPEGYDTVIGDRGAKLSGGQRQRVTIARALLKDAEILILDEATSALDTESERRVQAALENLMRGRTTFVIAHRLSTIQHADRILVLDRGRIVETGSHGELQRAGGLYSRLLEMQDRPRIAEEGALRVGGE
ncbi:MAG: ABC transporter ATP-binding protein [Planctomycetota bacterium]